jgi:hypothetical protein
VCENSVSIDQLSRSVHQTEEALGMAQEWLEDLHHLADRGKQHAASVELAQATVLLGEARMKLEKAIDALGGSSADPGVTVELV